MLVPTYLLTLLSLLVASVFSAPINVSPSGLTTVYPNHQHSNVQKHALPIRGHHVHLDPLPVSQYHHLDPRSVDIDELETRSLESTVTASHIKRDETVPELDRRGLWSKFKKSVGRAVKSVGRGVTKAAHAVKKTVSRVHNGIKKTVGRVTHAVKKAATWVKKNGRKIAKIGAKAIAAGTKAASHVVAVIPGLGKPVAQSLRKISHTADVVGDKINVRLDGKWAKAMEVMDKIQHPLGHGIGDTILTKVLRRDEESEGLVERDLPEESHLYERDELELEVRAMSDVLERSFQEDIQPIARSLRYLKDA
ncbi:hypothetical protein M408DRAFT_292456 [Serendipita vermifera MAFF 305830]|uniref:Uncharacterized protein n=1 Tax=Serendipita vermifera MAFF 305830 TaxID=933852 RepID=A0A0C3AC84_SERVB|nr:hypothetical protein M408DRAFT_292456 [Serendipita vermifera MAFF 305830]